MRFRYPESAGKEVCLYHLQDYGRFDSLGLKKLLTNVKMDVDNVCEKRLLSEDFSLLFYDMAIERGDKEELLFMKGVYLLSSDNVPRDRLVRGFQKKYERQFDVALSRIGDKEFGLEYFFRIVGVPDVVRKVIDIKE